MIVDFTEKRPSAPFGPSIHPPRKHHLPGGKRTFCRFSLDWGMLTRLHTHTHMLKVHTQDNLTHSSPLGGPNEPTLPIWTDWTERDECEALYGFLFLIPPLPNEVSSKCVNQKRWLTPSSFNYIPAHNFGKRPPW